MATPDERAGAAPAAAPLTALVVGTDDWAIEQSAAALVQAGHQVLRCHEAGEAPFPCNALRAGRTCPLDVGFDVVVTSRARPDTVPGPSEMGVVCALHAGAPLVVAGIAARGPFLEWATSVVAEGGDVAAVAEAAVAGRTPVVLDLDTETSLWA